MHNFIRILLYIREGGSRAKDQVAGNGHGGWWVGSWGHRETEARSSILALLTQSGFDRLIKGLLNLAGLGCRGFGG